MATSRILAKIQKCFNLAKSNNAGEAAAATRQAQKLMLKHNLTASDLSLLTVSEAEGKGITKAKVPPEWVVYLRGTVANAFGVEIIHSHQQVKRGVYHSTVSFIGVGEKPQAAQYVYDVLFRQVTADRKHYLQSLHPRLKARSKRNQCDLFCLAWVEAVRGKVEAIALTEHDREVIKRYKATTYGELPVGKARDTGPVKRDQGAKAVLAGMKSGAEAQLFHGMSAREPDRRLK